MIDAEGVRALSAAPNRRASRIFKSSTSTAVDARLAALSRAHARPHLQRLKALRGFLGPSRPLADDEGFRALHARFGPVLRTFFDRGELARVLQLAVPPAVAPPVARGPSVEEIKTEVLHGMESRKDPLGTALMDWMTGGKDWVNGWGRR